MKSKLKKITVFTSLAVGATCYPFIAHDSEVNISAQLLEEYSPLIKVNKSRATTLNEFKTFTYSTPTISSTTISGKGVAGASVGVWHSNGKRLAIVTVSSNGNYKLTIPKQKAGTVLTLQQQKNGYQKLSKKVTVLNEFGIFTTTTPNVNSTSLTGTGVSGASVKAYANGKQIGETATVDGKGNYKLTIPKQKSGVEIEIKISKSGYKTSSKKVTVLNVFNNFTVPNIYTNTTSISGKGVTGATVKVFSGSTQIGSTVKVNSNGNYKVTIPKQKAGATLKVEMSKAGYQTNKKTIKVAALENFKTFTVPTIKATTTSISGKGVAGAKVAIYDKNGDCLDSTTVDSNGNYNLRFFKQKDGTILTIKQSKSGYNTATKKVTVILDTFKTFTYNKPSISTTTITGKGEPFAMVYVRTELGAKIAEARVDNDGNYKLTIPKQKAGTVLNMMQTSWGFELLSKKITVLNEFKTFTYSTPTTSSTTITGKGVSGAKITVYDNNGKNLGSTTVDSKGAYKVKISKQKAKTVLTIKQTKSGYLEASKKLTVK